MNILIDVACIWQFVVLLMLSDMVVVWHHWQMLRRFFMFINEKFLTIDWSIGSQTCKRLIHYLYVLIYPGLYRFTSRLNYLCTPLQRPYVVYPPEGPRPPPPEELRERAREIARKRQQSWMDGGFSRRLCPGNNADDESISQEHV